MVKTAKRPRLPSVKTIMRERGCSVGRAESLRALMEIRADQEQYKQTGRHFLDVVSARDLQRTPSLAVTPV